VLSKRFDQARPFTTLGVVLLVWLLLPVAFKTFTRSAFFEIQAPITLADSYVDDLQNFWASELKSKQEFIKAGKSLAGLIANISLATQTNKQQEADIRRLENLLNLPPMPAYRLEPARVARREFTGWWQRMVIRKGKNHGITVGAPVVFSGGVVGRVVEVHAYTSVVDLITSASFRIAASAEGDNRPVSYQGGDNETFSAPRGTVEFVPLDVSASPSQPQRLVTSGLGGVFPPGLIIGSIAKLEPSTDGMFKIGEVKLDERLNSLTEITVLVPLNPDQF
jgi:rod shape-determining protein MreC